jgi:prolyl-tRNA synthetase
VRVEVGPRDVAEGACVAARRDRPGKAGKETGIPLEPAGFVAAMQRLLGAVQVGGPCLRL